MTCEDAKHQSIIIMVLDTQHVKDCVYVHYMEKCADRRHEIMQGAKCETHNH